MILQFNKLLKAGAVMKGVLGNYIIIMDGYLLK